MRKIITMGLVVPCLTIALYGCSSSTAEVPAKDQKIIQESVQPESTQITDLTGAWEQVNSNSENTYHIATIEGNTIEVYCFNKDTDTKSLYWAGSFVPPTAEFETYLWSSANDTEKTATEITASVDNRKNFVYENGQISYSAPVLGVTQTVKLEKQN